MRIVPRISLAQLLIVPVVVAICLASATLLWELWQWHLPWIVLDLKITSDGRTLAVATGDDDRYCIFLCDSQTGALRSCIEVKSKKRRFVKVGDDCDTWVALADDGTFEAGRLSTGERWTLDTVLTANPNLDESDFFRSDRDDVVLSRKGQIAVLHSSGRVVCVDLKSRSLRFAITIPEGVRHLRVSTTGKTVVAASSAGHPDYHGVLIDIDTGIWTFISECKQEAFPYEWIDDDRLVGDRGHHVVTSLAGHETEEKEFRVKRFRQANTGRVRVPMILMSEHHGPMTTSGDEQVLVVALSQSLYTIDINTRTLKHEALDIPGCNMINPICAVSSSEDGSTLAASNGRTVFVVDPKRLTAHEVAFQVTGRVAKSIGIVLLWGVSVFACVWLFWRLRPDRAGV